MGCLPLFAELAQQIGGVARSAEGVDQSLRSSEIRTLLDSTQGGESGNPSVPPGHLPY